jgi:hypothetical protein
MGDHIHLSVFKFHLPDIRFFALKLSNFISIRIDSLKFLFYVKLIENLIQFIKNDFSCEI